MNKQLNLTVLISLFFFSLIFINEKEILADSSTSVSSANTLKANPAELLGVRVDFVYDKQDDVKNTLKAVVYLIQEDKEVFTPVYKADNLRCKVIVKGNFYVGDKLVHTQNYSTNKAGELTVYLDEISALSNYKKGEMQVELDPVTVGGVDLDQKKYHDKVYREFTFPIPKRTKKSSVDEKKQENNKGRAMMDILVEALIIGSTALILGYLIGRLHAKCKFKKKALQQEKDQKFKNVPKVKSTPISQATTKEPNISPVKEKQKKVAAVITSKKDSEQISERVAKDEALLAVENNTDQTSNPLDQLKALRKHAQKLLDEV
ncbi:MAG: hypothetical protein LBS28_03470 [Streptococcaceae bacterium]|jgi:hypothetical protein|nr:hypothetical protein [Streptococcaceae bacterium]